MLLLLLHAACTAGADAISPILSSIAFRHGSPPRIDTTRFVLSFLLRAEHASVSRDQLQRDSVPMGVHSFHFPVDAALLTVAHFFPSIAFFSLPSVSFSLYQWCDKFESKYPIVGKIVDYSQANSGPKPADGVYTQSSL
jgi:hypothetical protein